MKYTVLFAREGEWRLERDISFRREMAMREVGFVVLETWMAVVPTYAAVARRLAM